MRPRFLSDLARRAAAEAEALLVLAFLDRGDRGGRGRGFSPRRCGSGWRPGWRGGGAEADGAASSRDGRAFPIRGADGAQWRAGWARRGRSFICCSPAGSAASRSLPGAARRGPALEDRGGGERRVVARISSPIFFFRAADALCAAALVHLVARAWGGGGWAPSPPVGSVLGGAARWRRRARDRRWPADAGSLAGRRLAMGGLSWLLGARLSGCGCWPRASRRWRGSRRRAGSPRSVATVLVRDRGRSAEACRPAWRSLTMWGQLVTDSLLQAAHRGARGSSRAGARRGVRARGRGRWSTCVGVVLGYAALLLSPRCGRPGELRRSSAGRWSARRCSSRRS